MFDARSPLPTYWQVAVLTDFDGTAWLPDPTTEAAAQSFALSPQSKEVAGLPALPEPTATKTFRAQITIGDLESTLLPLPPTTYSVDTDADLVPGFGAVQPVEAAPGLTYIAVARVPVNPSKPGGQGDVQVVGPRPSRPPSWRRYLQLPTEPADVGRTRPPDRGRRPRGPPARPPPWPGSSTAVGSTTRCRPRPRRAPDALESFLFSHQGRVLPAVRRRLRRAGPDRRPAHAGRGGVHDRRLRGPTALPDHRGRRPCLARGLSGPDHGMDLVRAHPGVVGRGHRRGGELGLEVEPRRAPGPGPRPPPRRPSPPSAIPSRPT